MYSQVYQPGITDAVGKGAGITVQSGVGPAGSLDPNAYAWTTVTTAHDVDGFTPGDHANDEYQLDTVFPSAGAYSYAFRAKLDAGGVYEYCGSGGPTAALDASGLKTITSAPLPTAIGDCVLRFPAVADNAFPGVPFDLYGRVFVAGTTEAAGPGRGIRMQASLDVQPDGGGAWIDAGFFADNPSGAQAGWEEYRATATTPGPGHYSTAFRAQVNDGGWTFCELGGKAAVFDPADAGSLTVRQNTVDYCRMLGPAAASGYYNDALDLHGEVYVALLTPGAGAAAGVAVEAGYGQPDGGGFVWQAAPYDASASTDNGRLTSPNNDGYALALPVPIPGAYATAMRASLNGGPWTYCELGTNGLPALDPADAGTLAVNAATVDACAIQFPLHPANDDATTTAAGAPVTYYGQVFSATFASSHPYHGIVGQVGVGPVGSDPRSAAGWSYQDAVYNPRASPPDNNDEFKSTLGLARSQSDALVYRFSGDGRQTWTYCDQKFNAGGFDPAQLSRYTTSNNPDYDACHLSLATQTSTAGAPVAISAIVSKADGGTLYPVATAQALLGPAGSDPGGPGWTAYPAAYAAGDIGAGGSTWTASVDAGVGGYGVAFRFQKFGADGSWWSYAAADGGCATGFQIGGEGALTVSEP